MEEINRYRKIVWKYINEWWSRSLGISLVALLAFMFGLAYQNRSITEDCKFMGSFRDGTQAYNCQQRVR